MTKYIDMTGLSRFLFKLKGLFLLKKDQPWKENGGGICYGEDTVVTTGAFSVAEGYGSYAQDAFSHAEGNSSHAEGAFSHAEGLDSHAVGYGSHAEGEDSHAEGSSSHAEGSSSHAEGSSSHAEGNSSHAEGAFSHAEGLDSHAVGYCSHAEGSSSHAEGSSSHAEGSSSHAEGNCSHAEGNDSRAGRIGFALSYQSENTFYLDEGVLPSTIAINDRVSIYRSEGLLYLDCSVVTQKGADNITLDSIPTGIEAGDSVIIFSTVKNFMTEEAVSINDSCWGSIGNYSHAEGSNTQTYCLYEHAEGMFNKSNTAGTKAGRTLHSIGVGSGEQSRKNAFEVMQNGDAYLLGVGGYLGTNPVDATSLQETIGDLDVSLSETIDDVSEALTMATPLIVEGVLSNGDFVPDVPSGSTAQDVKNEAWETFTAGRSVLLKIDICEGDCSYAQIVFAGIGGDMTYIYGNQIKTW